MDGDGNEKSETNQSVRMNGRHCLPVEEGEECIPVKVLPSPSPPSRQEMLEHNLTHWPFRSWCRHCVAGKAKASKHSSSGAMSESEIPIISMDYAFMGDKDTEDIEENITVNETEFENNEVDESKAKILIARDSKSRVCTSISARKRESTATSGVWKSH